VVLFFRRRGGAPQQEAPTVDLTGTWLVLEEIVAADGGCSGSIGERDSYSLHAFPSGNTMRVEAPAGQFTGTVSSNRIQWTGSYNDDGGRVTITRMDVTAGRGAPVATAGDH
jgi:hypothetical protein